MRSHHRILAAFAGLLLLCAAGTAAAQSTIRCESQDGNYRSCPVSTTGGVTLTPASSGSKGLLAGRHLGLRPQPHLVTMAAARIPRGIASAVRMAPRSPALVLRRDRRLPRSPATTTTADNNHYNDGYYNGCDNLRLRLRQQQLWPRIRCESRDGRFTAAAATSTTAMRMRRQSSSTSCVAGPQLGRGWPPAVGGRRLPGRSSWCIEACRGAVG